MNMIITTFCFLIALAFNFTLLKEPLKHANVLILEIKKKRMFIHMILLLNFIIMHSFIFYLNKLYVWAAQFLHKKIGTICCL